MPSAQIVYGASQTINSAGYVQICVFAEAAGLSNPGAVSIVCGQLHFFMSFPLRICADLDLEELTNLYKGQSMELFWKFHTHCPTEEEYYEMVDGSEPYRPSQPMSTYAKTLSRDWRLLSLNPPSDVGGEPGLEVRSYLAPAVCSASTNPS